MPFRTLATLQSWVDEFDEHNPAHVNSIRVIPQDSSEGADTGLVAVRIPDSPTEIYLEPPSPETGPEWTITFEPREQPVTLGSHAVERMAEQVAVIAALCGFLQAKSDAFLAQYSR